MPSSSGFKDKTPRPGDSEQDVPERKIPPELPKRRKRSDIDNTETKSKPLPVPDESPKVSNDVDEIKSCYIYINEW